MEKFVKKAKRGNKTAFTQCIEQYEMPLGTVKSVCYRALKKLHIQIEEVDFYE